MSTFQKLISLKLCREVAWIRKIKRSLLPVLWATFTSGFMGNFRFRIVFEISRQLIDQSELVIAQIEAKEKIKVFYFANWGLGHFGIFGVILGSKSKDFQTWANYIPKWSSWSRG